MTRPEQPTAITDVFMAFVADLQEHPAQYLMAGTGVAVVSVPLAVASVAGAYALILVVVFGGIATDEPDAIVLGTVAATFASLVVIGLGSLALVPLQASLLRAVDRHFAAVDAGEPTTLGFKSAWDTPMQDLGTTLAFSLLQVLIVGTLLLALYLPGVLFIALTDLAWPHLVLERKGIVAAYRFSLENARDHTAWQLGYVVLFFSLSLILPYLPVIGLFVTTSVVAAFRVLAFRAIIRRS